MRVIMIVILWLAVSFFNFGALNAREHQEHYYCSGNVGTPRSHSAMTMFFSLIPVGGTVIAIFDTGFLEYGWRIDIGCSEKQVTEEAQRIRAAIKAAHFDSYKPSGPYEVGKAILDTHGKQVHEVWISP